MVHLVTFHEVGEAGSSVVLMLVSSSLVTEDDALNRVGRHAQSDELQLVLRERTAVALEEHSLQVGTPPPRAEEQLREVGGRDGPPRCSEVETRRVSKASTNQFCDV